MRTIPITLAAAATVVAVPALALAAGQSKTVHGGLVARPPHTLARGTTVPASQITGHRVFVDARHGFALVSHGQAQYPAATTNGGTTWRTDGPALHLNAAQAPLAVTEIGAAGRRTIFAWGDGNVVDVTTDGGRHWRRALWSFGTPMAVVPGLRGHLVAFVDISRGGGAGGPTWQYVSRDGGRTWHYTTKLGGG